MNGKIAVCLLTCEREELTMRTAGSFARHNSGRDDLVRLHYDAASHTRENLNTAGVFGFRTIAQHPNRIGQMESLRLFIDASEGCEFIMWLENDWESVAPIPTLEFLQRSRDHGFETLRLFGDHKGRSGPRALAGLNRMGTKAPILWTEFPQFDGWQIGYAHWAAGGSIIMRDVLLEYRDRPRLKAIMHERNDMRTLRPVENIMWHIGEETTPGFMD